MAIEYRNPAEDELRATLAAGEAAFGGTLEDEVFERSRALIPLDRVVGAFDGGKPVGLTAAFAFDMTIPGGALPTAGVTWVGVLPSHRRRGILTALMRRQLDDLHERGEPLAALWASEAPIYGRFGYGIAAPMFTLDADRTGFAFRDDGRAAAQVRLVERDEALEAFPALYERVRPEIPGYLSRTSERWSRQLFHESPAPGYSHRFYALLELDGEPAGYAWYRIKSGWDDGFSRAELYVIETGTVSPAATREVWRFLFGIDLIARVRAWRVDSMLPLFLMTVDPRRLGLRIGDGLWVRFVDVEAALRARSWATDDQLVVELTDELCPWNAGRWSVGADVRKVRTKPDLALDVADLASAYLGAFDFRRLAAAGRVEERTPGALDRATLLFRTTRPPFCPEEF